MCLSRRRHGCCRAVLKQQSRIRLLSSARPHNTTTAAAAAAWGMADQGPGNPGRRDSRCAPAGRRSGGPPARGSRAGRPSPPAARPRCSAAATCTDISRRCAWPDDVCRQSRTRHTHPVLSCTKRLPQVQELQPGCDNVSGCNFQDFESVGRPSNRFTAGHARHREAHNGLNPVHCTLNCKYRPVPPTLGEDIPVHACAVSSLRVGGQYDICR